MNSRAPIIDELQQLESNLPSNVKEPVFNVPENYFEQFADRMLAKVRGTINESPFETELFALAPTLAGLAKKMPLAVPENYFGTLADEVPVLMRSEDELPSILLNQPRTMPYAVPQDYFHNLPQEILFKVAAAPAKVVTMRTGWLKMAAAAALTGVIALGALLAKNESSSTTASADNSINAGILKGVTAQDLDQFIQTTDAVYTEATATTNAGSGAVHTLLKDVSNKELEAFLADLPAEENL